MIPRPQQQLVIMLRMPRTREAIPKPREISSGAVLYELYEEVLGAVLYEEVVS